MRPLPLRSIAALSALPLVLAATAARADEPIELGGRKAISVLAAVNAESQFASATLVGSADFAYITRSARFELGGGIRAVGLLAGPAVLAAYFPYATVRVNTRLFGPEENMLFYGGLNVGAAVFTIDADEDDESSINFAGGPRLGFEYYFSPRVALRIDNAITVGQGVDDDLAVSNTLSLGARVLF